MKILIYGAGVVGCTYGWQLANAGVDVTILVRKGKKESVEANGIKINCIDYRKGPKSVDKITFRPHVIDELSHGNDFEYILVATNCLCLKRVLPILSSSAGNAHILFFQNIWDDFDEIERSLSSGSYFFGFPFMAGGGRDEDGIRSAISGLKQSHTPLGEPDGKITPRLQKIVKIFSDAGLKPVLPNNIKLWLVTHYAVAAGLSAGIMKAGNGKSFAENSNTIKEAIRSIREGLQICRKRGFDIQAEKSNRLYTLPYFISIPIAKKVFSNEALCRMFDGHTTHSPEEMERMICDIIEGGKKYNIDIRHTETIYKDLFKK